MIRQPCEPPAPQSGPQEAEPPDQPKKSGEIIPLVFKPLDFGVFFFFKIFFIFREGKGGRKRERESSMCGCLLSTPYQGPALQPRHVP